MSWKAYKVKVKSRGPTLIGHTNLGVINQSRYYIPAKNLWAMLTAYLTKCHINKSVCDWDLIKKYARQKDYYHVGKEVDNHVKFSYFFPSNGEEVFYPNFSESGIKFGGSTKENFEKNFIGSFASTAIDRGSGTALEDMGEDEKERKGSYHEVEYIKGSTTFIGYVFIHDNFKLNEEIVDKEKVKKILKMAFKYQGIGGERNYGFGSFEVLSVDEEEEKEIKLFDSKTKVKLDNEKITISNRNNSHLTAFSHLYIDTEKGKKLEKIQDLNGDLEPLVGKEWSDKKSNQNTAIGPGKHSSEAKVCLTPGTSFKSESEITIGEKGIWEIGQ